MSLQFIREERGVVSMARACDPVFLVLALMDTAGSNEG
jgi:hypothetical protein